MSRKTTSDYIKEILSQYDGKESDWKRLSKKKNEDGEWVRLFENKENKTRVEVIEKKDGQLDARLVGEWKNLTTTANESFKEAERKEERELAASHCFAIIKDEYGDSGLPFAVVTPISYFEKTGYCNDQSGPIRGLLEHKGCYEAMESTYGFDEGLSILTPVDAAHFLKNLGIQWRRDFQDAMEPSLTPMLEKWDQSAKAPAKPANGIKPAKP
jgi:hypothetical protein